MRKVILVRTIYGYGINEIRAKFGKYAKIIDLNTIERITIMKNFNMNENSPKKYFATMKKKVEDAYVAEMNKNAKSNIMIVTAPEFFPVKPKYLTHMMKIFIPSSEQYVKSISTFSKSNQKIKLLAKKLKSQPEWKYFIYYWGFAKLLPYSPQLIMKRENEKKKEMKKMGYFIKNLPDTLKIIEKEIKS